MNITSISFNTFLEFVVRDKDIRCDNSAFPSCIFYAIFVYRTIQRNKFKNCIFKEINVSRRILDI